MAKIILNIPDNEFGVDIQNKFQEFFGRVKAEIDNRVKVGDTLICGAYEIETAEMFLKAFEQMEIVDDSTLEESISLLKANVMVACDTSPKVGFNTPLNKAIEALEQQPCETAIDKKEVFNILRRNYCGQSVSVDGFCVPANYREDIYDEIKSLPPVTPTHKVGKWIRKPIRNEKGGCIGAEMICSYCKKDNEQDKKLAYCPHCGAEMRGNEND